MAFTDVRRAGDVLTVGAARTPSPTRVGTSNLHANDTPRIFYVSEDSSYWSGPTPGSRSPAQPETVAPSPLDRLQEVAVALATMRDYEHPHRKITSCLLHDREATSVVCSKSAGVSTGECRGCAAFACRVTGTVAPQPSPAPHRSLPPTSTTLHPLPAYTCYAASLASAPARNRSCLRFLVPRRVRFV